MDRQMKVKENAITLIALIITIVILIILTAITINSITSTNLFGLAKGAAENYIEAGKKEQEAINAIMSAVKGLGDGGETGDEAGDESEPDPPPEVSGKLSELITDNNYGDRVDYPVNIDDDANDYDWKIFYKDTNGRIFIIADDYVKNTEEHLSSSLGSAGMTPSSSLTYNVYWKSAPEFESIDDTILTLFMATGYILTESYPNSKCTSKLLDTSNWTSFLDDPKGKKYGEYAIGGPTLEMWCDSWNNAPGVGTGTFKKIYAKGTNTTGYYVSSDTTENQYYLSMNGTTGSLSSADLTNLGQTYPMYFPHTTGVNNCYGYWLASPSALDIDYLVYVDYGGSVGSNWYSNSTLGVRPVVCLKSEISATYDKANHVYHLVTN